jgi:hypothetical protein
VRHQRNRQLAVRVLGGHHHRPRPVDPHPVEHTVVYAGIPLDDEIAQFGRLVRQVISLIDDDHEITSGLQPLGYQTSERTEADDDDMVVEMVLGAFHG